MAESDADGRKSAPLKGRVLRQKVKRHIVATCGVPEMIDALAQESAVPTRDPFGDLEK